MLALLCMWLGISVPLTFVGYFFGFRKQVTDCFVPLNVYEVKLLQIVGM